MKTIENLSNTDATSWQRTAMIARYFEPTLRVKSIILVTLSLAEVVIASILGSDHMISVSLLTVVFLPIILAPVMFATHAADQVFYSLPALPCEKRNFVFLYSFVFMPLAVIVPANIYLCFFPDFNAGMLDFMKPMLQNSSACGWLVAQSLLSSAAQIAIGLWVAFASRGRARVAWTMIAVFGSMMLEGVPGFVLGFISAIDPVVKFDMFDGIAAIGPYVTLFWASLFILAIYKASRAISYKQV